MHQCKLLFPLSTVMNMKRHILDVHVNKNIKPFKCTMCSFASHAKRYLLWHVRRHHNPNNPPGGDPKGTVLDFIKCEQKKSRLIFCLISQKKFLLESKLKLKVKMTCQEL